MIHNGVQRTSIFLAARDREAIRAIQQRYGVSTDSDAIRLALRVLAEAREIALSPLPGEPSKHGTQGRHDQAKTEK